MKSFTKVILAILVFIFINSLVANAETAKVKNCYYLNMRTQPNNTSKIIKVLEKGEVAEILSENNGWCKAKFEGVTGYLKNNYVSKGNYNQTQNTISKKINTVSFKKSIGYVNVNVLRVRTGGSLKNRVIGRVYLNNMINITGEINGWYRINYKGKTGWVFAKHISSSKLSITSKSVSNKISPSNNKAKTVVSIVRSKVGNSYSYGGNGPYSFDCSGLVKYAYAKVGISLNRTASAQSNQGKYVSKNNLQLGDAVFFDTNGGHNNITHVGIYIGGGQFVHASNPRRGIRVDSISNSYYTRNFMKAKRYIY